MKHSGSETQPPPPSTFVRKAPFLVFEGLDGSGKSTLIQNLAEELTKRQISFRLTREPGGTPLAEAIRHLLLRTEHETPAATTELLLFAASRAQHVARVIQPTLKAGSWVISDRYTASSVAFQCFARGLERSETDWLNQFATQGLRADLTILLDLDVEESEKRQLGRTGKDRMENEARTFHESVRQGYLQQAKEEAQAWFVLDAKLNPADLKTKLVEELGRRGWLA